MNEKELTLEEKYEIATKAIEKYLELFWYSFFAKDNNYISGIRYITEAFSKIEPKKAKQIRLYQKNRVALVKGIFAALIKGE